MSSKKDKYLESAQKFIIKGQFDRASVDLEQAVALDPSDLKVRQRLAETLIRTNRQKDAVSHYETIGKSFANSGFYLKAIAVYKQIQKLDPDNINISVTLAELNVSHGLVGNALAEFSQSVNRYLKIGKQNEALQLLERMREVDPANLNTLLKIAETLHATGNSDAAYEQYCHLAQQLWDRPDKNPFTRLCDRIKALFPDKGFSVLSLLTAQLERGDTATVFTQLKEIISQSPDNIDAWYLMADTIRAMGDTRQLRLILARISQRFPSEARSRIDEIELAISLHETENSLGLLNEYRTLLLANNLIDILEKFYNELHQLAPEDTGPLDGLCWLYGETGDLGKLGTIQLQLSQAYKEPEPEIVEDITPSYPEPEPTAFPGLDTGGESIPPLPDASRFSEPEESLEWEEEIELGIDEEPVGQPPQLPPEEIADFVPVTEPAAEVTAAEPQSFGEPVPEREEFPSLTPDATEEDFTEIDTNALLTAIDIGSAEDLLLPESSERVVLTIEHPLPVEAFLEPALEPVVAPEPEQTSPWDELSLEAPATAMPQAQAEPLQTADELVELLVGHLESFDWESTDNRIAAPSPIHGTEGVEVEILAETEEAAEITELPFELEDLANFTEALFGGEPSEAEAPESGEYGLDSLLTAFKKGVEEQLDETDTESHYNLGIAYKEMGLYDEAIHEFRSAGHDPRRAADCISLQGVCLREKGDIAAAESMFREGLALHSLSGEALLNLKYELAHLLEQGERCQEALELYREIIAVSPSYRDVSLNISRLSGDDDLDILDRELIELSDEGD